jgi:hypothetical protein
MELPDLNCTRSDVKAYIHQARRRFEENCKNTFFLLPLTKLHPFKATSMSNTPLTSSADSSKDSFTQISPAPKKEINSTKSSSESDHEDESDKSAIVFSYKEKQEILEEAVRLAEVPEQEKALIKIITATGKQSPIQQRFIATQPNPKTDNYILTNKPLRTRIKPLATPREQNIKSTPTNIDNEILQKTLHAPAIRITGSVKRKTNLFLKYLQRLQSFVGSDPDSTYFIMSVWPIKNPCKALGVWWDLLACL